MKALVTYYDNSLQEVRKEEYPLDLILKAVLHYGQPVVTAMSTQDIFGITVYVDEDLLLIYTLEDLIVNFNLDTIKRFDNLKEEFAKLFTDEPLYNLEDLAFMENPKIPASTIIVAGVSYSCGSSSFDGNTTKVTLTVEEEDGSSYSKTVPLTSIEDYMFIASPQGYSPAVFSSYTYHRKGCVTPVRHVFNRPL